MIRNILGDLGIFGFVLGDVNDLCTNGGKSIYNLMNIKKRSLEERLLKFANMTRLRFQIVDDESGYWQASAGTIELLRP